MQTATLQVALEAQEPFVAYECILFCNRKKKNCLQLPKSFHADNLSLIHLHSNTQLFLQHNLTRREFEERRCNLNCDKHQSATSVASSQKSNISMPASIISIEVSKHLKLRRPPVSRVGQIGKAGA